MNRSFDLQGHRGARGLRPENTIPGFSLALKLGVTTLELDVVISADGQVVVSHDPVVSAGICSHPDGRPVEQQEESGLSLYAMSYEQIRGFDCGERGHPGFPDQVSVPAWKPLLSEVIDFAEARTADLGRPSVWYNIETKSTPSGDGINHPDPETFVRLVHSVIRSRAIADRVIIQSFDKRTLIALHNLDPDVSTSLLVSRSSDPGIEANLEGLGFVPDIYSPDYRLVTSELVGDVHTAGMKLIPWTVNEKSEMLRLLDMDVDGLITDYPDRGVDMLRNREDQKREDKPRKGRFH